MNLDSKRIKDNLFLITFGVTLFWGLSNISSLFTIIGRLLKILSPFILGLAISFIFNGPMMMIENVLYGKKGPLRKLNNRVKRPLSYLLTLTFFIGIISVLLFLVIPEMTIAAVALRDKFPDFLANTYQFAARIFDNNPFILEKLQDIDWVNISDTILSFFKRNSTNWLGNTFNIASSAFGSVFNFGLAFVFSVYALLSKEELINIFKKFVLAYFPEKIAHKTLHIGYLANEAFSGFLSGKLREVFVIIGLFAVTMKLLNFPYALTISVLIGTLTLIPWFGVFVGFAIGFFLILAVDVKMALWFLVVFVIIYQVEGNLIYPIVVGQASGLSSIWIFVAGTLGAQIGGIAGLMLSIPIFSVIYALIADSANRRLKHKNIEDLSDI